MCKFNVGDKVNWTRTRLSWQNVELVEYVKGGEFDGDCRVNCDLMGIGIIPEEELELVPTLSPIRTVTRREIVPGQYGHIEVSNVNNDGVSLWLPRNKRWSADQLREAAHILNQLAEALEDA